MILPNLRRCSTMPKTGLKTFKEMPGLNSLPIIGPFHHFLPVIGSIGPKTNFVKMQEILHKKHGSVVKLEGVFARSDMVFLFEPEHYTQVFKAEEDPSLRPGFRTLEYYRTELRKSRFQGLTTSNGREWRDFRTKVNPPMLKIKLLKLYAPGIDEIAKEMVNKLKTMDGIYLKSNLNHEMSKYSLESVALVCLGTRIGCLDDTKADHPGKQLLQCSKDIMELTFLMEFMPHPWRYISTPKFRKLMDTFDLQWNLSVKYINQAKRAINERGHDIPEEDKSILEKLLAIDEHVAVMMANEMLMAGIDTVSFSIVNVLYQLAKHQDKQDKLREEIRSGATNKRYLKACIKESLRILPVVSANLRKTSKEHIVGDYILPEGVEVIAPNEYLSRLETHYPQPLDFLPERWIVDKTHPLHYGSAHPMVTLPFGFGVRSCIGRRIAELEMEVFVTRLVDECKITWNGPDIKTEAKVLNNFVPPFYFEFENAK